MRMPLRVQVLRRCACNNKRGHPPAAGWPHSSAAAAFILFKSI